MGKIFTHDEPVWRNRSNFVFFAEVNRNDVSGDKEQLWGRKEESNRVQVCSIPFFIYDLSLGDVVELDSKNNVTKVVSKSGRLVFRVFYTQLGLSKKKAIEEKIRAFGCLLEQSSEKLIAVDVESEEKASTLSGWLLSLEDQGIIQYETGRTT